LQSGTEPRKQRAEPAPGLSARAVSEVPANSLTPDSSESTAARAGQLQAELFVVSAGEPDAPPVEGVRVRMPSSNPDIVVYWLMDAKDKDKEKGD
jgi:hypothetical protein